MTSYVTCEAKNQFLASHNAYDVIITLISWRSLLIDTSMVRKDQSIGTKIKFIRVLVANMQGKRFYTKIHLLINLFEVT